jgi:hypothetical protein
MYIVLKEGNGLGLTIAKGKADEAYYGKEGDI